MSGEDMRDTKVTGEMPHDGAAEAGVPEFAAGQTEGLPAQSAQAPVPAPDADRYIPPTEEGYKPYEPPTGASYEPRVTSRDQVLPARTAAADVDSNFEPYEPPAPEKPAKKGFKLGIFGIILAVLGLFVVVGIFTFAHPCVHADGSEAVCYPASQFILRAGVVVLAVGLVRMFLKRNLPRIIVSSLAAVAGLLIAVVPGTILPLCSMATMACQAVMHPFAMLIGAIILLAGIVDALLGSRQRRIARAQKALKAEQDASERAARKSRFGRRR